MPSLQIDQSNVQEKEKNNTLKWSIAIHGGAGVIVLDEEDKSGRTKSNFMKGLEEALKAGKDILQRGGTSLEAVESAVKCMEDNPLFNAGRGSVFTSKNTHEMDASIMDGRTKLCGAVSGVQKIRNPITLARAVMEKTPHIMLVGEGAEEFAVSVGMELTDPHWFDDEFRSLQLQQAIAKKNIQLDHSSDTSPKAHNPLSVTLDPSLSSLVYEEGKKGTVGAVALDVHGNLASATSTGGMTNKLSGRVGDSPIIGAGTYANNNTCAISCTGVGEQFMRHCVAFDISACMEYKHLSLQEACVEVVHGGTKLKEGDGGVIGVDKDGRISMEFNSRGMFRGCANSEGLSEVHIWKSNLEDNTSNTNSNS